LTLLTLKAAPSRPWQDWLHTGAKRAWVAKNGQTVVQTLIRFRYHSFWSVNQSKYTTD
jgi:hypothetical protein